MVTIVNRLLTTKCYLQEGLKYIYIIYNMHIIYNI